MSAAQLKLFKCLPIVQGDYKDTFDLQAIRMCLIHNVVIRGYNSIIYYSGAVKPDTKEFQSFLEYCVLVNEFLHHHHAAEEEIWFPLLEVKLGAGALSVNVEGHKTFGEPLHAFEELVGSLKEKKVAFEVGVFRQAVYAFMEPLQQHLAEEIQTIRSDILRKAGITAEELASFSRKIEEEALTTFDLSRDLQVLYINGDSVNGAWFPEIPALINFYVKYIIWYKHSDLWAFGSCDKQMRCKPQFAAYEPELEPKSASR